MAMFSYVKLPKNINPAKYIDPESGFGRLLDTKKPMVFLRVHETHAGG